VGVVFMLLCSTAWKKKKMAPEGSVMTSMPRTHTPTVITHARSPAPSTSVLTTLDTWAGEAEQADAPIISFILRSANQGKPYHALFHPHTFTYRQPHEAMSDDEGEVYAYSDDGGSDVDYAYGSDEVRLGAGEGGGREGREGGEEEFIAVYSCMCLYSGRCNAALPARVQPALVATSSLANVFVVRL